VVLRPRDDRVFYANQIRIFDYSKRAEPLRDAIRENMEGIDRERNRDRVRTEQEKFPEGAKVVWKLGRLLVAPSLLTE